jgi:hypothetical protein
VNDSAEHKIKPAENSQPDPLTRIRGMYTLAATDEAETSEVDRVIVKHFEEIVAEISLAIASRKENNRE